MIYGRMSRFRSNSRHQNQTALLSLLTQSEHFRFNRGISVSAILIEQWPSATANKSKRLLGFLLPQLALWVDENSQWRRSRFWQVLYTNALASGAFRMILKLPIKFDAIRRTKWTLCRNSRPGLPELLNPVRRRPGTADNHSLEYSNAGSIVSPSFVPPGSTILLSANLRLS